MTIMSKRGNLDNVVTYEHICDTRDDMDDIDPKYITLGSTAIVIKGSGGLEVYMATSDKEWVSLASISGGDNTDEGSDETNCIYIDYADELEYSWNQLKEFVEDGKAIILKYATEENEDGDILYYLSNLSDSSTYKATFITDTYINIPILRTMVYKSESSELPMTYDDDN